MDEEALARELAQLERQQRDAREPAWDDVANGRRSVDEVVAELRARGEDEAELSRMAELMAPLPGAFDDALAERLVESLEPAEVIAMPEREPVRWHRLGWAAAGLLAAAALVVVVVLPASPGPRPTSPRRCRSTRCRCGRAPPSSGRPTMAPCRSRPEARCASRCGPPPPMRSSPTCGRARSGAARAGRWRSCSIRWCPGA